MTISEFKEYIEPFYFEVHIEYRMDDYYDLCKWIEQSPPIITDEDIEDFYGRLDDNIKKAAHQDGHQVNMVTNLKTYYR